MPSNTDKNRRATAAQKTGKSGKPSPNASAPEKALRSAAKPATVIESCINNELRRYFDMLDGEEPSHMYRMVVRQAEFALIRSVMTECRGNQTKASEWLGISRGNLRNKLATMEDSQE